MIRPSLILAGLAVLVTAAPAAAAGPKLTFAASSDRDGDGRVDTVSVRFSGKVKGRGKFSVAGMRVIVGRQGTRPGASRCAWRRATPAISACCRGSATARA